MADTKISDLGAIPALAGTDVLPIVDATDTTTKKVSITQLDSRFATAAQGALADTATQPADLGTLAAQDDIAVPGDITATGTASASTFLRGDGAWATPAGGGSVDTSGTPVANDIARFTDADTIEGLSYTEFLAAVATGTPSGSTYLRGDGTWATPAGSGATVTSGAGAPGSTPAALGDIYIDTTADVAYMATGSASSADWKQGVAVATSTAGTWESRPQAQIVIWAAGTDTAATTPGAATGDDIVILAQDADLTAIAALTSAADKVPYATGAGTWAMADLPSFGRTLIANTTALAAVQDLRTAPATVTGTTDTLAAADDNTVILYTSASAKTVTLANIATGFECVLVNLGAGALTVVAGGMSFANSFTPKLTVAQGESLYVKQTAASTFIVVGGTAT